MAITHNPNGLTLRELKEFLAQLPDTNPEGEDYGVWLETGKGLSSPVTVVAKLNEGDVLLGRDLL